MYTVCKEGPPKSASSGSVVCHNSAKSPILLTVVFLTKLARAGVTTVLTLSCSHPQLCRRHQHSSLLRESGRQWRQKAKNWITWIPVWVSICSGLAVIKNQYARGTQSVAGWAGWCKEGFTKMSPLLDSRPSHFLSLLLCYELSYDPLVSFYIHYDLVLIQLECLNWAGRYWGSDFTLKPTLWFIKCQNVAARSREQRAETE